jgi:eukaryotic-like serine/threonine-protein kinase
MESTSLQPGQVLEDTYRIVRRIGEGGMGEVYEATHSRLAGRYAVKLIRREVASNPDILTRFRREAQVTSALRHPNIVQVLDFRLTPDGMVYLVMEFLDGADLATELARSGPLALERACALIDQVASGLAAAHEQGVVHRDLKPANLFLITLPGTRRELIKIVDFGISKTAESGAKLTRTAAIIGTPQYMAPEQALGQHARVDGLSDQFALACIAYEMISGRAPFAGDTIPAVMYQLVHGQPPPLSVGGGGIPPAVEGVIRRGLSKQPEDRYPRVLDFAQALDAAARGKPVSAPLSGVVAGHTQILPAGPSGASIAGTTLSSTASEHVPLPGTQKGARAEPPNRARRGLPLLGAVVVLAGASLFVARRHSSAPQPTAAALEPPDEGAAHNGAPASAPGPSPRALPAPVVAPSAPSPVAVEEVTVDVLDPPPGLLVSVDGRDAAALPLRLVKGSGSHNLVFRAPGFRPSSLQLNAEKDAALTLKLKKSSSHDPRESKSERPTGLPESGRPGEPRPPARKKSSAIIDL